MTKTEYNWKFHVWFKLYAFVGSINLFAQETNKTGDGITPSFTRSMRNLLLSLVSDKRESLVLVYFRVEQPGAAYYQNG